MRTNTLWPWPYQTILFEGTLREQYTIKGTLPLVGFRVVDTTSPSEPRSGCNITGESQQ